MRAGNEQQDLLEHIFVRYSLPANAPNGKAETRTATIGPLQVEANGINNKMLKRGRARSKKKAPLRTFRVQMQKVFPILIDKEMASLWTHQQMKLEIVLQTNKARGAGADSNGRVLGSGFVSLQRVLLAEQFTLEETVSLLGTFPIRARQRPYSGSKEPKKNKKLPDSAAKSSLSGRSQEHLCASVKLKITLQRQAMSLSSLQITQDLMMGEFSLSPVNLTLPHALYGAHDCLCPLITLAVNLPSFLTMSLALSSCFLSLNISM